MNKTLIIILCIALVACAIGFYLYENSSEVEEEPTIVLTKSEFKELIREVEYARYYDPRRNSSQW